MVYWKAIPEFPFVKVMKTSSSLLIALFALDSVLLAQPDNGGITVPVVIQTLFKEHCLDCHQGADAEAELQLDTFSKSSLEVQLDVLNRIQSQVFFGLMPPEDAEPLGKQKSRQLSQWLTKELRSRNASRLDQKLEKPGYGNFIDHESLFSGEHIQRKGFTWDRRWLISEYIFDARFNRILNHRPYQTIDGKREHVIGDNNRRTNLTNPFLLPNHSGVRYYANTPLNGGHLLTMITNSKEAATAMIHLARRDRRYLPAVSSIMHQQWEHEKTLDAREVFLNRFIERLLKETEPAKHLSLLPRFQAVAIAASDPGRQKVKKAPFHAAQPGSQELVLIFRTMQRHQQAEQTDEQLIRKCEQEWFYFGDSEQKIRARVTFLRNYMPEWREQIKRHRYAQRHAAPVYRPLPDPEMKVIQLAIRRHRSQGDRYNDVIRKCLDDWETGFRVQRQRAGFPKHEAVSELVLELYEKILERPPTPAESEGYHELADSYFVSLGHLPAIEKLIQTLMLKSDFVYRNEFGVGPADEFGRRMMSPRDGSYAISLALTDSSPDRELEEAARAGRLKNAEDYRREVRRLLKKRDQFYVIDEAVQRIQLTASITNTPIRKLRFFREFFGYARLLPVFKDNKRFGGNYDRAKGRLVGEADRLIEHILQKDRNVIEELLTTEKFYVFHSGDNEAMKAASQRIRRIYEYFKDLDWQDFDQQDLLQHREFLEEVRMRGVDVKRLAAGGRRNSLQEFKTAMASFTRRFDKGQTAAAPFVSFPAHGPYNASTRTGMQLRSPEVAKFFNIRLDHWNYPFNQPAPVAHRKGMLTHPAWLISHAGNTETDPVIRGKWIREKLLAGTVPDLPVTVDAVIPEDHHKTLRQRLEKTTGQDYCWKCHRKMDPLGLPFEMYDDFGRYRTEESLEHPDNLIRKGPVKAAVHVDLRDLYKTLPVNAAGRLSGTGERQLDGEVVDALDLIDRIARSKRARQSVIRHAFRYFMGRNEMLSDSKTLIDADQAYLKSGGSFDAVIVSLLSSDSFLYRKSPQWESDTPSAEINRHPESR
ncbi:MAG: DUF1588 domain-containing protein [Planctomycetota bacterium]|nr:DUF1588 domain-containing protein [Planctomycetota bacterium]